MNVWLQVKKHNCFDLQAQPVADLNKTIKKNQLSFPTLAPTATETVDSAQLLRQKSLVMGVGNGNRHQGIKGGW